MLSSSNLMEPPRYLELAPPEEAAKQIDHLFVFRDTGVLSGGGHGRFATDLFTLSVTRDDSGGGRVSLAEPRPYFSPRPRPFLGVVAGLRLSSRPQRFPDSKGHSWVSWPGCDCRHDRSDFPTPKGWTCWPQNWPGFRTGTMTCLRSSRCLTALRETCALPHQPELTATGPNVERCGRKPACRGGGLRPRDAFVRLSGSLRQRPCC